VSHIITGTVCRYVYTHTHTHTSRGCVCDLAALQP
jgi:hypothetical protein